jgi:hypothetical protein
VAGSGTLIRTLELGGSMALQAIDTSSLPEGEAEKLAAILQELQGRRQSLVTGGASAVQLTLTGIATTDTIQSVIRFHTGVPSDVTAQASIPATGKIAITGTDTTGDMLLVSWFRKAGF